MTENAIRTTRCPYCPNSSEADQFWTIGGVKDCEGFALQCAKCDHVFQFGLDRDINYSRVALGSVVLDNSDNEVSGGKEDARERRGLMA